jgi:hypothetical protein
MILFCWFQVNTFKALTIVESWCTVNGLNVNPSKTELIVFTRRRNVPDFSIPSLFGSPIARAEQVKHLGVVLDSKLSWKSHLESKLHKATTIFWLCRRAFDNS